MERFSGSFGPVDRFLGPSGSMEVGALGPSRPMAGFGGLPAPRQDVFWTFMTHGKRFPGSSGSVGGGFLGLLDPSSEVLLASGPMAGFWGLCLGRLPGPSSGLMG